MRAYRSPGVSGCEAWPRRQRDLRPSVRLVPKPAGGGLQWHPFRLAAAAFQNEQPRPRQQSPRRPDAPRDRADETPHRLPPPHPPGLSRRATVLTGERNPNKRRIRNKSSIAGDSDPTANTRTDRAESGIRSSRSTPAQSEASGRSTEMPAGIFVRTMHQYSRAGPGQRQRGQQKPGRASCAARAIRRPVEIDARSPAMAARSRPAPPRPSRRFRRHLRHGTVTTSETRRPGAGPPRLATPSQTPPALPRASARANVLGLGPEWRQI